MTNLRKHVLLQIIAQERKLKIQQSKFNTHKLYFSNWIENNKILTYGILGMIFFVGWRQGSKKSFYSSAKQFSNFVLLSAVAVFKNQFQAKMMNSIQIAFKKMAVPK